MPEQRPVFLVDSLGNRTEVPVLDNRGVTGNYRSSEGVEGAGVWARRASWMLLTGEVNDEPVNLVIIDHPANPGYPAYWHARGYGLFSVNPLGQKVFSDGAETLNLRLAKSESVTFRYRFVLASGMPLSDVDIEQLATNFRD